MRLSEIPALLIEETVRTWRRRLLAGAVIIVFGILAIGEGISTLRLALHVEVGPVYARLILTALFFAVVVAAALILLWRERRAALARSARADEPFGGEDRVGAIAEAISLGYSLAQDFRRSAPKDDAAKKRDADATTDARETTHRKSTAD